MRKNVLILIQSSVQRDNNDRKRKILFCASLCLDVEQKYPGIVSMVI